MTEAPKPELIPIENIDHFTHLISQWHAHRVKVLEHMLSLPEGTEMQAGEGQSVVMEGDRLDGFKAGLGLALMELGELPFVVQTVPTTAPH